MKLVDVIDQYLMDCGNRGIADTTLSAYRRHLGLMERWLGQNGAADLASVTVPLLRQFLHFLSYSDSSERYSYVAQSGKLAPSTIGRYVASIKVFFQWCLNEDLISSNPATRIRRPKVPQKVVAAFTPEQVESLLAACDTDTRTGFRDFVMLMVFYDTGMRVSELCGLRVSDVSSRYVKVHGKGHKEREIGLSADVSKLLWKYINTGRPAFRVESDYVFLSERGGLTIWGVEKIFKKIKDKSGVGGVRVSPHTFRHTFAKFYLKRGGDLFKLSRELGHSSVQITGNIYLGDFKSSDAREDHDKYSPATDLRTGKIKGGTKSSKGGKRK